MRHFDSDRFQIFSSQAEADPELLLGGGTNPYGGPPT